MGVIAVLREKMKRCIKYQLYTTSSPKDGCTPHPPRVTSEQDETREQVCNVMMLQCYDVVML